MNANSIIAVGYLRLSREEATAGESSSIKTQRTMITDYCNRQGINIVRFYADDGWSGSNFNRPGFQEMMQELENGIVNTVITKDLSRLGRDMREASYFAEQFFPEHGIRYLTIADNFDNSKDNIMAPFQFAMNEVYLRDCSKKVRDALKTKRENGQYCACAPYGYMKDPTDRRHLIPDPETSDIVTRIFQMGASGMSCEKISQALNQDGVMPPLKFRVLYRGDFGDEGAARASDFWNQTTVKRILKNRVYLGHTVLGKTKKASLKSKKKLLLPSGDWVVTEDTHTPLTTEETFERAAANMRRNTNVHQGYDRIRRSIFGGIAYCSLCGHAMVSGGAVYKGERAKYWFLCCNHMGQRFPDRCSGARIKYVDIVELVRQELNNLLAMSGEEIDALVTELLNQDTVAAQRKSKKLQLDRATAKLEKNGKLIAKLYMDNSDGRLSDDSLYAMLDNLQKESAALKQQITELAAETEAVDDREDAYRKFFSLVKQHTEIEELDEETLRTFIERIEIGPKELPEGYQQVPRNGTPYRQKVRIFYRFIGELVEEPERTMPVAVNL